MSLRKSRKSGARCRSGSVFVIRHLQQSIPSNKRITSLLSATQGSKCSHPVGVRRWKNKLTTPSVFNYFARPSPVVRNKGLLRGGALSRFPCPGISPFSSASLRPPSTITSLTGEQVRRSTRRIRAVLVAAPERKSLAALPRGIRVPGTFCLSNKSGRKSRGRATTEMSREGERRATTAARRSGIAGGSRAVAEVVVGSGTRRAKGLRSRERVRTRTTGQ